MDTSTLHSDIIDAKEQKNIGTFTSIYSSSSTKSILEKYLYKNEVDSQAYKSIETYKKLIDTFMCNLYENCSGKTVITSGSTEAIILALLYAREKGKVRNPNIIVSETAHYSIFRAAKLLSLEVKMVTPSKMSSYQLGKDIAKVIDRNTVLVVGTAGTTELGIVDNIDELNQLCLETNVPLHIDAAIGGFILPFINASLLSFEKLEALQSLNISGHKFGLSLPGCGLLLVKDKELIEQNSDQLEYLSSGSSPIETLLVTKSTLGTVSLGQNIFDFNYEGYKKNAWSYLQTKKSFTQMLRNLGISYYSGSEYIPHIFIDDPRAEIFSRHLSQKGWTQHAYKAKLRNKLGIRIVIKKSQESMLLNDLVADLVSCLPLETLKNISYTLQ